MINKDSLHRLVWLRLFILFFHTYIKCFTNLKKICHFDVSSLQFNALYFQLWNMAEIGRIWRDWDAIMAISIFTFVNTKLQLLSKTLWAMIHKTSTHLNEVLLLVQWSQQTFYLNFFRKVAEYRRFTLSGINIVIRNVATFP